MNFLDHFISASALNDTSEQSKSYHIFIELLAHFEKELSSSEYMELYYFYTLCEKCLTFSRRNEINSAHATFKTLSAIDRHAFSPGVVNAVDANYYSCLAYLEYVEKRYDSAIACMEEALKYTVVQKDKMAKFLPSIYELNVNILRVYIKTKNTEKTIEILSDLLGSVIYDINNSTYLNPGLNSLSHGDKKKWAHHIVNNSIHALWRKFGDESIEADAIYRAVFQNILHPANQADTTLNALIKVLSLNQQYLDGRKNVFNKLSEHDFDAIRNSPFYLKRMVLNNYLSYISKHDENIEEHANFTYFAGILTEFGLAYKGKPVYS
jgi:tetratricopeptide (TPR) repeat protein